MVVVEQVKAIIQKIESELLMRNRSLVKTCPTAAGEINLHGGMTFHRAFSILSENLSSSLQVQLSEIFTSK